MEPQQQEDGSYPRLNAAMVNSGQFHSMIVSIVGRFHGSSNAVNGAFQFQASDGGFVTMDLEQSDFSPPIENGPDAPVFEIVGQIVGPNNLIQLFVTRELSKDMDLDLYDRMIQVQHNSKFTKYFQPLSAGAAVIGMATN